MNAWASGGYLPAKVRGSTVRGLMGGWDWYATWAALAGVEDITDHKAAAARLPPVVRSLFGPDLNHASLLSVSRVRFGWLGLESCVRCQDSLNMWPMISGENGTSPRHQIVAGSNVGGDEQGRTSAATAVGALIRPPWKIILGEGPGDILDMAGWPGPCVAPPLLLLLRGRWC